MKKLFYIFITILVCTLNAQSINYNKYSLRNNFGIGAGNNLIGPFINIEFGYGLKSDLYLSPQITVATSLDNDVDNQFPDSQINHSYYSFNFNIMYSPLIGRKLQLGTGVGYQISKKIIYKDYDNPKVEPNYTAVIDPSICWNGNINYSLFKYNNLNVGLNTSSQIGKYAFYMVGLYIELGN